MLKQAGNQKPRRPLKRTLGDEPPEDDSRNQDQNNSQRPPIPKRRSKGLPSPTLDLKASPSPVDAKVSRPAVKDGPSKPRQKPGPKPGFKLPSEAESPPPWSWDVTGTWTLTCPRMMQALELENSEPLTITIHLANNPRHTKIGRQLWA